MDTPRIKRFALPSELPLALASLVIVTAGVDLLIALRPAALSPLRDGLQRWVNTGAGWPALFAASVAVLAAASAAAILAAFIRGVQRAPYVWLAPWLVGGCTVLMGSMPVKLPLPMSTPVFAGLSALLLIGGGEVFRPASLLRSCMGGLLLCSPFVMLTLGYAQSTPPTQFGAQAQLFGAALAFAALVAILLSVTAQRMLADRSDASAHERQTDQLRARIFELLERCNANEARAIRAEQQLTQLGYPPNSRR